MTPRRTANIPDAQRKRKPIRLSLGADVHAALKAMQGEASRYVEALVMRDQKRQYRRSRLPQDRRTSPRCGPYTREDSRTP